MMKFKKSRMETPTWFKQWTKKVNNVIDTFIKDLLVIVPRPSGKTVTVALSLLIVCSSSCRQGQKTPVPTEPTAASMEEAAKELIGRILPEYADRFIVESMAKDSGRDAFELASQGDKIILRGNDGISIASALNYWLNQYAHCSVSWNSNNLEIPKPFPLVTGTIHKVSPHTYRYYFNYTTYTLIWWDWERWQKEIDWMALHGINLPLAVQGQNVIWDKVYKKLGFTQADMDKFFTGPSWFIWFWMGNMDGWGGPLPKSWMDGHEKLEKQILARERSLGMKPVLQGFTGHVPPNFKAHFPNAKLRKTNWEGRFADTYILDPADSMFTVIGKQFMQEQIKTYGTDHYYAADVFNEMVPPSSDSIFLNDVNQTVYRSMADIDTAAVWVMQGWLFQDKKEFWKPTQIKALLNAVPDNHLLVLDLWADENPIWSRTEAFYGKNYIWCMLHNFGGRQGIYGNMEEIASGPAVTRQNKAAGNMQGIGVVPEGIEQNPVIYDLMLANVWTDQPIDLDTWLPRYVYARYGKQNEAVMQAWDTLRASAYHLQDNSNDAQSIITGRPTMEKSTDWTFTDINYNPASMVHSWILMLKGADDLGAKDAYQYDLVDITRQVLANYANTVQQQFAQAYAKGDTTIFKQHFGEFMGIIDDLDRLMATRKEFMLGTRIQQARNWGTNQKEKDLYEMNARDLITLWADKDCVLHEYAFKQWSGLLQGFYKARWEQFQDHVLKNMAVGQKMDEKAFDAEIKNWEWQWVNAKQPYPTAPKGDAIAIARELFEKYHQKLDLAYAK